MWFDILLIFFFIILNGFFAAAEIAVITARRSRIKQLIDQGNKTALLLNGFKEKPARFLATIQIGVTLAVTLASAIGGALSVQLLKPLLERVPVHIISASSDGLSIAVVAIVLTYFTIVFGELIPKSIALSRPTAVGLVLAPAIERFSKLTTFAVKILSASTNLFLKPFGKKAFRERGHISEEEIKLLIEEGKERGIFEAEEKELIHSVFAFTDIFVKEVMLPSPQMVTININAPVDEVKRIILDEKFSRYPVFGKDINDVRGILHAKDFFNALLTTENVIIRRIIKPPLFVPETLKISVLLREMQKKRVHMAIVIDEYGAVSGLVTLEDLIEEIIGEIRDEFDTESPVIRLGDGTMIIDASLSIRDLSEDYSIDIPEAPEYETLGGFIVTYLQRLPQPGDEIDMEKMKLRVVEMVGKRIAKVKLERLPSEPTTE